VTRFAQQDGGGPASTVQRFNGSTPSTRPPCVLHEDDHLLVVNKPAGWNTHAPAPFAGEGIYDWLKHREPRWANLAIIHRLDKETSGVIVFGKTALANRSLTEQFTERKIGKTYVLLTDRPVARREFVVRSKLARAGERYCSGAHGEVAETRFEIRSRATATRCGGTEVLAEPRTGRTHQVRVHAAETGFPILGDTLYGGSPFPRVCLHAAELKLQHPASGEAMTFHAPADFAADPRQALRAAIIEPASTDAFRLIHGASDGWPGWYVERLGDFLLSESEHPLNAGRQAQVAAIGASLSAYHKIASRRVSRPTANETSPQFAFGQAAPERFVVRENGVKFELSFSEGASIGLFLDQRDNRRRLLTGHVAAGFPLFQSDIRHPTSDILNCFAYTCGFSVCAAPGNARTTSLDLSKKYLEWGRRNFLRNQMDPTAHDFIYGDVFDWLKRFARRGRAFDVVLLDPPTFSRSKAGGVFRVEKDYGNLVAAALPVLRPGGVLFASTNAADWPPEHFLARIEEAVRAAGRRIAQRHYVPQPPDHPVSREEPAYLKTVWLRVE
jgi:23S rRNA (cytosine1962-C5)-methyltransferase